jgi:hypothetical protein
MKPVVYEDPNGFRWKVLVKDEDDPLTKAQLGIPVGPPDLREIDLDELLVQMNHALVQQECFTWADAQRNQVGIAAAINIFKRRLIELYRQAEADAKTGL